MYARTSRKPKVRTKDHLLLMLMTKLWKGWRDADVFVVVRVDTILRWHRAGFRRYWTWKARRARVGRPSVALDIKRLVRQMAAKNVGWGAPRIHGELLKLGYDVSEASVSKLMTPTRRGPGTGQSWSTFLRNHLTHTAAIDLFTVYTVTFKQLYVCVVLACARRRIVHVAVTQYPTAAWAAQCAIEAFPEETAPRFLVHDRDPVFGGYFAKRVSRMGISECVTAPRSPWQNPYAERVIGS